MGVPEGLITVVRHLESRKRHETYEGWVPQMRDALAFAETAARYGTAFAVSSLLRKCPAPDRAEFGKTLEAKYQDVTPLWKTTWRWQVGCQRPAMTSRSGSTPSHPTASRATSRQWPERRSAASTPGCATELRNRRGLRSAP